MISLSCLAVAAAALSAAPPATGQEPQPTPQQTPAPEQTPAPQQTPTQTQPPAQTTPQTPQPETEPPAPEEVPEYCDPIDPECNPDAGRQQRQQTAPAAVAPTALQTAVPASQTAPQLPNTGLAADLLAFGGVVLLAGGIALRRLARN
jgi:hypothetical protein